MSLPVVTISSPEKDLQTIAKEIKIDVLQKSERRISRYSTISETSEDKKSPWTLLPCSPAVTRQMLVVLAVDLLNFNSGFGIGVTSPMIAQLTGSYLDTEAASSWFASSLVIGQVLGVVISGLLGNKLGRKSTCLLAAAASTLAWAELASSRSFWRLILGRVFSGLSDCFSLSGGFMYMSEISHTKVRGSFLNSANIFFGLGIAFGYIFGSNLLWRYSCLVAIAANLTAVLILLFCFESPVFLLLKHQVDF